MNIETIIQKISYKNERIKKLQKEIKSLETKRTQLENEEICIDFTLPGLAADGLGATWTQPPL